MEIGAIFVLLVIIYCAFTEERTRQSHLLVVWILMLASIVLPIFSPLFR